MNHERPYQFPDTDEVAWVLERSAERRADEPERTFSREAVEEVATQMRQFLGEQIMRAWDRSGPPQRMVVQVRVSDQEGAPISMHRGMQFTDEQIAHVAASGDERMARRMRQGAVSQAEWEAHMADLEAKLAAADEELETLRRRTAHFELLLALEHARVEREEPPPPPV